MSWAKLDDGFYSQPEVLETDLAAVGLHCLALAYCARHLTDGRVSEAAVRMLARGEQIGDALGAVLVATNLWVRDGGGFRIRSYLETNLSAKDAKLLQKAARVRMRKFRLRSLDVRANKQGTNTFVPDGTGEASKALASEKKQQDRAREASEFLAFYAAYPRKVAPREAEKAWAQTAGDRPAIGNILAAIARQKRDDWRDRTAQHIPHPATWLRAHSWLNGEALDQPDTPAPVVLPTPLALEFAERERVKRAEREAAHA